MISHTTVKNITNKHLFNTMKINSLFVSKIIFTLLFFLLSPSKTFANVLNSYNTRLINTLRKETQKIDTLAIKLETSIIAKETRDNIMKDYHINFPQFDWKNNMGYGTKNHVRAIKESGISYLHRISFEPIKSINNDIKKYSPNANN